MKTFGLALGSIVLIIAIIFILLVANRDVGDIVYSMLSGTFVSFFVALVAMHKNLPSHKIILIVFFSILSSAFFWIAAMVLINIATINLYSNTAIAFDLIIGSIGSIAMSSVLYEKYINQSVNSY